MDWIRLVYQENRRIYGCCRVTQALRRSVGVKINHKTVLRLMQKMGLRSVARKRKVYKRLEEIAHYHHYPNLLSEIFPPIVRIKNGLPNPYPLLFLGVNLYNTDI